ncbi:MAG TPA: beta-L-arabinofuranosidase domain-containing protein [Verrucomicrobiae bacterium]
MKALLLIPVIIVAQMTLAAAPIQPLDFRAPAGMPDAAQVLSPADIQLDGWLGAWVLASATNRLMTADLEPLLAGYRHKPGDGPWIGEAIGKWLHAATLAWAYTGNPALCKRLDYAASELIKAQEANGYLGTYVPEKRFGLHEGAEWDVWSHKYCLLGLLTYYQFTGNEPALNACRKAADLLLRTFGPGKKSILSAGTHVGMAATSVLEPMVLLYRCTGDERYLDFARYIVKSWDEPNGPKIIQTLLTVKQVNKTANGKAYELLSNLAGLCELARATGDRQLLNPVLNAWQDIVSKRLYLTGSASRAEVFTGDYDLPNQRSAKICETCVTVTWMQLNLQLLRLTGDAKFANQIETTLYNHLAAAQNPDGDDLCPYPPLEGFKYYESGINCCHSSGPRGMALAPQTAYLKAKDNGEDALLVSTFETSSVTTELGGQPVAVAQQSEFPLKGESWLKVKSGKPARFAVRLRVPPWASPLSVKVNGTSLAVAQKDGWAVILAREWSNGDSIELLYNLGPKLVLGEHSNSGTAAMTWGPFVLAYDEKRNPGLPSARRVGFQENSVQAPGSFEPGQFLEFSSQLRTPSQGLVKAALAPFADAGRDRGAYRVWLTTPGVALAAPKADLTEGRESRSRECILRDLQGSINDGDTGSLVVTYDGQKADEDWFAVTVAEPIEVKRVTFVHGKTFHDGGWFDASVGPPQVQAQMTQGGKWVTVGVLKDYPATTATSPAGLTGAERFTCQLPQTTKVFGVRVLGKPASGDYPQAAFSSCGGLLSE